jgi:hypothetical protein
MARGRPPLERLLRDARTNATLAWLLVVLLVAVTLTNLVRGTLLWAGFAAAVAAVAVVPAVVRRTPAAMLPWELLSLVALPLLGRTFATVPVTGQLATYLSVAALALVVSVELHAFTTVRMSVGFAVAFVVLATMAAAGLWAVVRFGLDTLLGTTFLLDPALSEHEIERALMFEFVYSTAAGVLGGLLFEGYFRRIHRVDDTLPEVG